MTTECAAETEIDLDRLCINTIRTLSMDAIQKANSGHPGAPMGLAPAAYVLWTRSLRHNPQNPEWLNRDRFVLSGGHASMLLYSLLYLTGYDLTLEDLRNFRQWGSRTPGHPEYGHTPGVETTTGPLGQGFATAVGMAMAERHLAALYNRPGHDVIDHYTYVMCGDGDLMEGITAEAASLGGHLGLSRLICLYDDNGISIEGSTGITFTENVALRFQAYDWQVITVSDGNDVDAIEEAIEAAIKEIEKPSLIMLKTRIAYGSPHKQGSADAHGAPLGVEEVRLTKECLGCPADDFCVPDAALEHCRRAVEDGARLEAEWNGRMASYEQAHAGLSSRLKAALNGDCKEALKGDFPRFTPQDGPMATRKASGIVLNAVASRVPSLMGGSADLAPSNNTYIQASTDFQKVSPTGRNIRFGVREHAMGAILNGLALHKGVRPYGGTFLIFADYMRPSIRLAALMKQPVIYVFTHDSVAVGEDGPTHQPVEHLASLRCIPGLTVIRPADATETAAAWHLAMKTNDGPIALVLSRQSLPVLNREAYPPAGLLEKGAYILSDCEGTPELILMATGSEVHISLEAKQQLSEKGTRVRVVSMPSWELFERQPQDYKDSVLLPAVKARIAVEAGVPMGWERYTGDAGKIIGILTFGASAPGGTVLKKFGFTAENITNTALALLKR